MDRDHGKKHICKLCNRSFLTGRILGGHMRVHVAAKASAKEEVKVENSNMGIDGYGLRENPKKSWKFSGLNQEDSDSIQESLKCRVCGKQFETPRSLHGHMRHHSVEERHGIRCKECGKGFRTLRSLTGHMRLHSEKSRVSRESTSSSSHNLVVMALSDAETVSLVRRKRSNRMRYRGTPNSSFSSLNNESVSGFEVEQEVEEVAMCLMMLSRGVYEWGEFKSVSESLDNDSVSFEDKSLCLNKRTGKNEDEDGVFEGNDQFIKKKKPRGEKFDPCFSDSKDKTSECDEFDCEMVCYEEKKVELEVPIASFYRAINSKRPKLEKESGFLLSDNEIEKGIHDESSPTESEPNQEFTEEVKFDLSGLECVKCITSSKATFEACDAEMGKDYCTEIIYSTSDFDIADKKRNQFQCRICNKIFPTHQALGGHQTLHRTTRSSVDLKIEQFQEDTNFSPEKIEVTSNLAKLESIKDSVEEEVTEVIMASYQSKKSNKEYKCHICSKTFRSGQALGGHKRAHHSKPKEDQNVAMKQEANNHPDNCNALDINLPADMLDTIDCEVGFNSWSSYMQDNQAELDLIA